jgi:hypothetical protein
VTTIDAGKRMRVLRLMRMVVPAAALALVAGVLVAGCAGPTSMGGFSDHDARVTAPAETAGDVCAVRTGLLVIEVERIVVNEYPHHDPTSKHEEQPLLVRSVYSDGQSEKGGEVQAWVSPLRYRPGQVVGSFAAFRVLERPLRAMAGKQIVVRLAENDRTNPARWNQVAGAAGDAAGAGGAVGVPAIPSAVLTEGLHLLANLDKDDLILLWAVDARSLIEALGKQTALRFALATPRRTPDGKAPAATVEIAVFRQAEAGCP